MYNYDEDGLPQGEKWMDLALPYTKNPEVFRCPAISEGQGFGYAMNDTLSGVDTEAEMEWSKVPMVYESFRRERNAHDYFTSLLQTPRHEKTKVVVVGFADGHVRSFKVGEALKLDPLPRPVKPSAKGDEATP
jgi:prepilin-type processing-associated H-X9-DG protein